MKPFQFLNPSEPNSAEFNSRDISEKTKFGIWTPATVDISNVDSTKAYYQLYGPMVYYYIQLSGTAMQSTGTASIVNAPYGPSSESGAKAVFDTQFLGLTDATGNTVVANAPWATVTYSAGLPLITLPSGFTEDELYLFGWIFRN